MAKRKYKLVKADAGKSPYPDDFFDMTFYSPPYAMQRTYGIGADRPPLKWIDWQLDVLREQMRVTKGPVFVNVGGATDKRCYQPFCEGLLFRAWEQGIECYRPIIWQKLGIPGRNDDWFRSDTEYVFCFKKPGKLPYANIEAVAAPTRSRDGIFTYRQKDGTRVKQAYKMKSWANPGNVLKVDYSEAEIAEALLRAGLILKSRKEALKDGTSNLIRIIACGALGHPIAYEHEAPFPLALPLWFIKVFCPPGGKVNDPFCGHGTTIEAALKLGRQGYGSDIRRKVLKRADVRINTPWLAGKAKEKAVAGGFFDDIKR